MQWILSKILHDPKPIELSVNVLRLIYNDILVTAIHSRAPKEFLECHGIFVAYFQSRRISVTYVPSLVLTTPLSLSR